MRRSKHANGNASWEPAGAPTDDELREALVDVWEQVKPTPAELAKTWSRCAWCGDVHLLMGPCS